MSISLAGKWKLIRDGSDFMPGLDNLRCSPMVLKLLGKSDTEFIKIEKKKVFVEEQICLTYVTKSLSVCSSYQLGTLNYESSSTPSDTVFAIVQSCNEKFTEFVVHRLGPGCGQMSREAYTLDIANNEVKLVIEVNSGDGVHVKLVKYLARFDSSQVSHDVEFIGCRMTQGWSRYEFWPSTLLADCKVQIVKVAKIKASNVKTMEDNKVLGVLWTRAGFADDFKVNLGLLAHNQVLRLKDGEEIIIFCIQVTMNGVTWYVAHRYTEFYALKIFLLKQNPSTVEFKGLDGNFPGKALAVAYRKSVLESRIEGLGAFLVHFLQNARLSRQTSVDAMLSFLAIPENVGHSSLSIQNAQVGAPGTVPNPGASTSSSSSPAAVTASVDKAKGGQTYASVAGGAVGGQATVTSGHAAAAEVLWSMLKKKGMAIIKHGRQGAPKQRFLHCTPDARLLYWGERNSDKSVFLDEVQEIRLGTDIDPATPPHLIPVGAGGSAIGADRAKRGIPRSNSLKALKTGILYGTETLRRNCKAEDLMLSFSLILPTRTLDIQCKSKEDYDKLLPAIRNVCPPSVRDS